MSVQNRADLNNNSFILSGMSLVRNAITLLQDAGRSALLAVFTIMARIAVTIPTTGTADGGNTGNGTVTAVAAAAGGSPIIGTWEIENTLTVVNGGVWKLTDPNGNIIASELIMTVGAGLATVFTAGGIIFTITDAAIDFASGDKFTLAVTVNGKSVPFDPTAVNGAEIPRGVLMVDDVTAAALIAGDVTDQTILVGGSCTIDSSQLVFDDGSSTLDTVITNGGTVRDALAEIGIFAEDTVDIAGFEN